MLMEGELAGTAELSTEEAGREEMPEDGLPWMGLARADSLTELIEASAEDSEADKLEADDKDAGAMLDEDATLPDNGSPIELGATDELEDKLPPRPSPAESMLDTELDALADDKLAEDVIEAERPRSADSMLVMEAITESRLLRSGIE
jgi:hypothetical protein